MNNYKKLVKYFAIALACGILVSIISLIVYGFGGMVSLFGSNKNNNVEYFDKNGSFSVVNDIDMIDIEVDNVDIVIEAGDEFKIATDNDDITYRENDKKLVIIGKKASIFNKKVTSSVVIYIPKNKELDRIELESGIGSVSINEISVGILEMELGAGKVEIDDLEVLRKVDIDGGAGEIVIDNSRFNNLELDMGIGGVSLNGEVIGNNEINAGVGKLDLELVGSVDDYMLHVNKGIGEAIIDGDSISDNTTYGNGNNKLNIDGGIGSISVSFIR